MAKVTPQPHQSAQSDFATRVPRMTVLSDHPILRDEPSPEGDRFQLTSKLAAAYDILRNKDTRPPMTIAIYGDWGTGKSSAMRFLADRLDQWNAASPEEREGHPRVRPVWFDPWKYTSREEVWRGLIAELILASLRFTELSRDEVSRLAVNAAKRYGAALGRGFLNALSRLKIQGKGKVKDPTQLAEAELGFEIGGEAIRDIVDEIGHAGHPEKQFLNEFEESIRHWTGNCVHGDDRLVFFIDDLDRCLPDVTLEVIEALKLYLNIPKLMFVIGLDRSVVDAVVRHHYRKHGVETAKAEKFLDKLFQVEVDIAPTQSEVSEYLKEQVGNLTKASGGRWGNALGARVRKTFEDVLLELCEDNPREVKRLLNSTLLRAVAAEHWTRDKSTDPDLRFAQGAQLYLIRRCITRTYGTDAQGALRRDSVIHYLARCSQFFTDHPAFTVKRARMESIDERTREPAEPS